MKPEFGANMAEIVGIMQGDGCFYQDKLGKYHTMVLFHPQEQIYQEYVKKLMESFFQGYKFTWQKMKNERMLRNVSKRIGEQLLKVGLKIGNKVRNGTDTPSWIFKDKDFLRAYLRGMFDTDGCIYRKYDHYAQIQFKLASKKLIMSLRRILRILDYHPTIVQGDKSYPGFVAWKIYLSRQREIDRFFEEIKPANKKHVLRYQKIRNWGRRDSNADLLVSSS